MVVLLASFFKGKASGSVCGSWKIRVTRKTGGACATITNDGRQASIHVGDAVEENTMEWCGTKFHLCTLVFIVAVSAIVFLIPCQVFFRRNPLPLQKHRAWSRAVPSTATLPAAVFRGDSADPCLFILPGLFQFRLQLRGLGPASSRLFFRMDMSTGCEW